MNPSEELYCPASIDFSSLEAEIEVVCGKIYDEGVLIIDFSELKEFSTATVCLLIEVLRVARSRQCRIQLRNIRQQLAQLLSLYQLEAWFIASDVTPSKSD